MASLLGTGVCIFFLDLALGLKGEGLGRALALVVSFRHDEDGEDAGGG